MYYNFMLYPHIIEEVCEYIRRNDCNILLKYIRIESHVSSKQSINFSKEVEEYMIDYPPVLVGYNISNIKLFRNIIIRYPYIIFDFTYGIELMDDFKNILDYHCNKGYKSNIKILIKTMINTLSSNNHVKIGKLGITNIAWNITLGASKDSSNKRLYNYIIKKHQIEYYRAINEYLKND